MKLFSYAGFVVSAIIHLNSYAYGLTMVEEETEFWAQAQTKLKTQQKASAGAPPPPPPGSNTTVVNDGDPSSRKPVLNDDKCCCAIS